MSVIVLPAHVCQGAPAGEAPHTGYGEIDPVTWSVTCQELRHFKRCDCKRSADAPTRGSSRCTKCHGVGHTIESTEPGCGRTVHSCPRCGNRTRWDGGQCPQCEKVAAS